MKKTLELICDKYPHTLPEQDLIEAVLEAEVEAEATWVREHAARRPLFFDRPVLPSCTGATGEETARTKGDRAIVSTGGKFAKNGQRPVSQFLSIYCFRAGVATVERAFSTGRSFIAQATDPDDHVGCTGGYITINSKITII